MEMNEDAKVPMLEELDALAAELNNEGGVYVHITKYYYQFAKPETQLIISLTGDNELGKEVKEKVEKFLGVKLKAKKEVLEEGMIEFRYEVPGKFKVRLDRAMTCKKVGVEQKEVEFKVEIVPGKEAVIEMKKKMVDVPRYKCPEGGEFLGDVK